MNELYTPPVPNGYDEVVEVFGHPSIDMVLATIELPHQIGAVKHIRVHPLLVQPYTRVFAKITAEGLWQYIESVDGTWCYRGKRGHPDQLSMHAFGIAGDWNAHWNPLGVHWPKTWSRERPYIFTPDHPIVVTFRSEGFFAGGAFHNRPDPMHFQYATGC